MQNIKQWEVIPDNEPIIIHSCSKCGKNSAFISTGNFRINANKNNLDVWLIYQCQHCKTTLNMTILTRVKPESIPDKIYQKFMCNAPDLAKKYAFDIGLHAKNKFTLNYEELLFHFRGEFFDLYTLTQPVRINLTCSYPLGIRITKLLGACLGISIEKIKTFCANGIITSDNKNFWKEKLNRPMLITFHPMDGIHPPDEIIH